MPSKLESHPHLTRLLLPAELQSQVVNLAINNAMMKDHAGTPNNGAYLNGRTTLQQTTAYLHQGAGSNWQNTSSCIYYTSLNTSRQNPPMQIRTPLHPNAHQVNCNQGNFYQDSRSINPYPPQSSPHNPKANYLQKNVPAQWKPQGANNWKQYNVPVVESRVQSVHSSDNRMLTTTSPSYQQRVNTGPCESSLTHNNQVFYNRSICEPNTQQPPSYYHKHNYICQSQPPSRDYYLQNMPVQEGTRVPFMGQGSLHYLNQQGLTLHSKEANMQSDKNRRISAIVDSLKSYSVNQDACSTANNSSLYRGVQSSITPQPMPTNPSNTRQSSVFTPGETSSEYIPVTPPPQDMAGSSPETPHVVNWPVINQNKSVGEELRNSLSPEEQSTEEDSTVSPGHTNLKAIAVVQPLSQESFQVSSNRKDFDTVGYEYAATSSCESHQDVSELPESPQELSSRLAGETLADQHHAQMTPPPDVPRSQSCESRDDLEASTSKGSPGPTAPLTFKEMPNLIETEETPQEKCSNLVDSRNKLHLLFIKNFSTCKAWKEVSNLVTESKKFVKKHRTQETTLLPPEPGRETQHYSILGDNDLYTEPPFKSLWLNINDQLDDIDKEFGFPPCLKSTHRQKMDSQMDLITPTSITPGQTDREVPEKDLKQAEPKLVEPEVESSPIRAASPDHTQDSDSSDSCYSFKIQVLPPEEAKMIHEQTSGPEQHNEVAPVENQDSDCQPERDACSSVARDVPDSSIALLNDTEAPMENICCLSTLMESYLKPNQPLFRCQCSAKKSVQVIIDLTGSDSDSDDSVTEMMDISRKSPYEEMVLIENKEDNDPPSTDDAFLSTCADSESIQSVISTACDSNIENPSNSDTERSSLISKGEEMKFSDISSDSGEETEEQTPVATKTAPLPDDESKTERSPEPQALFPLDNTAEVSVEPPVEKHLDSNSKAAQLVLYGSVPSPGKTHKRKRHFSCDFSTLRPPEVLSVPLSSVKRQLSERLPAQEQSVKSKIFDIWRKSFPVKSLKPQGRKQTLSLKTREKQAGSPERKKLKLLDSSQRPVETKWVSPGEL